MKVMRYLLPSLALTAFLAPAVIAEQITVSDQPPTVHQVVTGDTLWDIATAYLEDPFMWPKIWWQNAQVVNPDLIYPGGHIRIPLELLKPEIREAVVAQAEVPVEAIEVVVPNGLINPLVVESGGYIAKHINGVGKVVGMHDGRRIMGRGDDILLKLKNDVQVGSQYQVVRPLRTVWHPKTHKRMGKLVGVLGVVTVTGHEGRLHQARLSRSFAAVESGDILVPYQVPEVRMSDTKPDLAGLIVATRDGRSIVGDDNVVYLDRGSDDGLMPGVRLEVIRKGMRLHPDGVWGSYRVPDREVATLEVLSVRDGNATARISGALEQVEVGDRFLAVPDPIDAEPAA